MDQTAVRWSATLITACFLAALMCFLVVSDSLANPGTAPSGQFPANTAAPAPATNRPLPVQPATVPPKSVTPPKPAFSAPQLNRPVSAQPPQLDFGTVWVGNVQRRKVSLSTSSAGIIRIQLNPDQPFRVIRMDVFGTPGPSSPIAAQHNRPSAPPIPATGPGTSFTQSPRFHQLLASASQPPFSLNARSGDTVEITLEFSPKSPLQSGGTRVGHHQALLTVIGSGWRADVPVRGEAAGISVGVLATLKKRDVHFVLVGPREPMPKFSQESIWLTLANDTGQTRKVSLRAEGIPPWLHLNLPPPLTLKQGSHAISIDLRILDASKMPVLSTANRVLDVPITLIVDDGTAARRIVANIRVLKNTQSWIATGDGWTTQLRCSVDGYCTASISCPRVPHKSSRQCKADVKLNGSLLLKARDYRSVGGTEGHARRNVNDGEEWASILNARITGDIQAESGTHANVGFTPNK